VEGGGVLNNVLRKTADAIRGPKKPTTTPGFLRPIDTEWIARELDLAKVAAERGEANLPPSDSTVLDAIEQTIIQKIESEWSWQGGELINQLRAYAQRLIGFSVASEFTNLQIAARDTLARLRAADHRAEAELGPLKEEYIGRRDDLHDFRLKHRLKRVARTPARRWTTFGLLSLVVAGESILNGFLFAKGSEFGLVGGVGIAIVISLVNVAFAFLLGLGPARLINIRYWLLKPIALFITTAGLVTLVLFHAFAAHYRDAIAAVGQAKGMDRAITTLNSSPWQLSEINSYYLFGFGILCAFLAFYKGCRFDDPYPFYGQRSRAAAEAREDYSDTHAELFEHLQEIKDETIQQLSEGITRIPLFPQQAANIRAQRSALIETFRGYEAAVVTAANQLLSKYRDENRRSRKDAPPVHFDRSWMVPHSFLNSTEVQKLLADHDDSEIEINTALRELRQLSQEVIDEYEKLLTVYPHPTKMEANYGPQATPA
jgi:hypothetical protein